MATDEDWQGELRARGYRLTPQRELVLEAVRSLGHSTPDEIAAEVKRTASTVNVSTVYRTLDLLEELGLVTHTHLGHGPPTYHAADDSDHLHLVCRSCGRVDQVDASVASALVGSLQESHGFEVDVTHVAVHGRCAACASLEES
ncbi:MAG TPA: Fur family transcriptional regulator [Actinomycetes bacterium]|nr:Fur family transcriptional regulator [Actinomycetes bacterium]